MSNPSYQLRLTRHHTNKLAASDRGDTRTADPLFGEPDGKGWLGRLGRYRIRKRLDCGGMAAIYLGRDDVLARWVALKVLLPDVGTAVTRERFFREARATAAVTHPSVVGVYETGEERGLAYIAMEYLKGIDLARYTSRRPVSLRHALRIGAETARALAAAHKLGYVHRDVKPGNLWLESPSGRVRLLDFGVSRRVGDPRPLTEDGLVVGTPDYMSPEQAQGHAVDHRSDLFSLGSVLYELTTGQRPFLGPAAMTILTRLVLDEPTPIRELNPEAPQALEEIIRHLMSKKLSDRPNSALAVARSLHAIGRSLRKQPRARATVREQSKPPAPQAEAPQPEESKEAFGLAEEGRELQPRPSRRVSWLLVVSFAAFMLAVALLVAVMSRLGAQPTVP